METGPVPTLSVVTFRLRGVGDQVKRALLEAINATGQVCLSSIELDGYWLRICILNQRSRIEDVDEIINVITRTVTATDLAYAF